MKPMARIGNSANLSWYAERHADGEIYVHAEVLRSDYRHTPGGKSFRRPVPEYHIRIVVWTKRGRRPAGSFTYKPARTPNPLVLGNRTVTRLVREFLGQEGQPPHHRTERGTRS